MIIIDCVPNFWSYKTGDDSKFVLRFCRISIKRLVQKLLFPSAINLTFNCQERQAFYVQRYNDHSVLPSPVHWQIITIQPNRKENISVVTYVFFFFLTGPNRATLNDIWRMVWQENSKTIIMLTNPTETGKVRTFQSLTYFLCIFVKGFAFKITSIVCMLITRVCWIKCQLFKWKFNTSQLARLSNWT